LRLRCRRGHLLLHGHLRLLHGRHLLLHGHLLLLHGRHLLLHGHLLHLWHHRLSPEGGDDVDIVTERAVGLHHLIHGGYSESGATGLAGPCHFLLLKGKIH
jgi:hypothetical protein